MNHESTDNAGVVAPPPVLYVATLALSQLVHALRPLPIVPRFLRRPRRTAGVGLIVGGLALGSWGFRTMRDAGTSPDPREPSAALVVDGPFHYSRNPLYIALTAMYGGITLLRNNLWGLLLLPALLAAMQRGVIEREEAYLRQRFGEDYHAYTERVPRWM